jgi:hypothetical protein
LGRESQLVEFRDEVCIVGSGVEIAVTKRRWSQRKQKKCRSIQIVIDSANEAISKA